jgi:hypothetical protein
MYFQGEKITMWNISSRPVGASMLRAKRNASWLVGEVALLTLLILGVYTDNETAQAQAPAALAAPAPAGKPGEQWKIEWEKLIKAAQAEGRVGSGV